MFWGLTMEPQKRYTQTVVDSFHISQAAIDISSVKEESAPTQVMVEFENNSYLLASLSKAAKIYQVPLDLNFEKGDHVSFRTVGAGTVHLTGYHVFDDEDLEDRLMAEHEEESDEEVEDETENSSFDDSAANLGKRKKATAGSAKNKKSKLDDSSDEDIDDFSSLGESTMLDLEAEESDGQDDDDDDEEEDSDEEAEDDSEEVDSDSEDEEEDETPAKKPIMNGNTPNKKAKGAKTPEPENNKGKQKKELNQSQQQTPKPGKTPKGDKAEKTPKSEKKTPKQEGATPKQEKGKKTPGGAASPQKKILQGGLIAEDLKIGEGAVAKSGKMVQVYYVGKLKSNNKQFDASSSGPGFKFRLGRAEVIRGWDVGVEGMRVGGKRRLTIPAGLAYGSKGSPPVIPPNSTLVFDVELRNVS